MNDGPPPMLAAVIERSGLDAGRNGTPLSDPSYLMEIDRCVSLLAATLDRLAAVDVEPGDISASPMDAAGRRPAGAAHGSAPGRRPAPQAWASPESIAALAADRLAAGLIDPSTLSAGYRRLRPHQLVESLVERVDTITSRCGGAVVLSNGATVFDNIRADAGELLGLSDWRGAAIADRHRDLAVAAAGLIEFGGPALVPALFSRLATDADPIVLDWYLLAVELLS